MLPHGVLKNIYPQSPFELSRHQPRSCLKAVASKNSLARSMTLLTGLHSLRSWLNAEVRQNIHAIVVTREVSHALMSR